MFRGLSKVTLDSKGRLAIPSKFRERIISRAEGKLVATINKDLSLLIFPLPEWDKLERKLMDLPTLHPETERLQNLLLGHATDLEMDNQGRILLPRELREFAGLEQKAMLVGQGNRFGLWDEQRWIERRDTMLSSSGTEFNDLPAELMSLSF